jgi:hypothetical protein
MAIIRRRNLKPKKVLAPKAKSWSEVPKELREQLLQEALKGKRRTYRA